MKKNIFLLTTIILSILTIFLIYINFQYKKQIQTKNIKIQNLQQTFNNITFQKNKLSANKDFIQSQYEILNLSEQKDKLSEKEIQKCMKNCNYTTVCMNECIYATEIKWQEEINNNIKLLEQNITDEQKIFLKESQNKWVEYKNAQQQFNAKVIGTKVGTIYTNILSTEQVNISKLRAIELKNLYTIISE